MRYVRRIRCQAAAGRSGERTTLAQHERYKDPMTEGRTVAVGDIHGCSAALAARVRAIGHRVGHLPLPGLCVGVVDLAGRVHLLHEVVVARLADGGDLIELT